MPLVSALAASHAPNILLEPGREWEDFMDLHYSMAPKGTASRPTFEQQKKLRQDAEAAFAALRADLEAAKPDVLIVVANDQFVNFFWNNIPTFFVTIADEVKGQFTRHKFHYKIIKTSVKRSFAPEWTRASISLTASTSSCSIRKTCRSISCCRKRNSHPADLRQYLGRPGAIAAALLSSRRAHARGREQLKGAGGDPCHRRLIALSRIAAHRRDRRELRSQTPGSNAPGQGKKPSRLFR